MVKLDIFVLEGVTTLVAHESSAPSAPAVIALASIVHKHLVTRWAPGAGHWEKIGVPKT